MSREERASIHVGWAFVATAVATFLLILLFQGAIGLRAAGRHESFSEAQHAIQRTPFILGLVQAAAFGLVIVAGVRIFGGVNASLRTTLGVKPISFVTLLCAFVAGLALQIPLAELSNLIQIVAPIPADQMALQAELFAARDPRSLLALFFAVVVVAPITEELFFRGLLMRGMRERHGVWVSLAASALYFGLSHASGLSTVAYSMVAGGILGFVALRADSILASLALHAGVNFLPMALSDRVFPIVGFNVPSESLTHVPPTIVIASFTLALLALAFFVRFTSPKPNDD